MTKIKRIKTKKSFAFNLWIKELFLTLTTNH